MLQTTSNGKISGWLILSQSFLHDLHDFRRWFRHFCLIFVVPFMSFDHSNMLRTYSSHLYRSIKLTWTWFLNELNKSKGNLNKVVQFEACWLLIGTIFKKIINNKLKLARGNILGQLSLINAQARASYYCMIFARVVGFAWRSPLHSYYMYL